MKIGEPVHASEAAFRAFAGDGLRFIFPIAYVVFEKALLAGYVKVSAHEPSVEPWRGLERWNRKPLECHRPKRVAGKNNPVTQHDFLSDVVKFIVRLA